MDRFDDVLSILNDSLKNKHKRHMVGGVLMSVSLLFAGLAFTVITLNKKEEDDSEYG